MREVAFIKKNKEKWLDIERLLSFKNPAPEKLTKAYQQLNNDLSFAQTYYPKSKLIIYLNGLTAEMYHTIYSEKKDWFGMKQFYAEEIPLIAYNYRKTIHLSILFFLFLILLGIISSHYDPGFIRAFFGDDYVDRTIANIKSGNPTAIYANDTYFGDGYSTFRITLNNLWVSLQEFFLGIFAGIGTLYIQLVNGIMVGTFLYLFYEHDVLGQATKSIFIHGSMELFGITISAASGYIIGMSWLFPGSISRKQSLLIKGKHAIKLQISLFPFIIFAGILEGFVTQYGNAMPLFLALLIVFGTLAFIVYYYLIFPYKVFQKRDWKSYQFQELIDEY